ncbi:hypothetical protein ACTWP5_01370 [Streptomyces sp. 4N509B]|uniref:hypothetical protein n=1 Tax=Streptomyces sp. 4N509B TaxID=3457413 RepID=UPI003FD3D42F
MTGRQEHGANGANEANAANRADRADRANGTNGDGREGQAGRADQGRRERAGDWQGEVLREMVSSAAVPHPPPPAQPAPPAPPSAPPSVPTVPTVPPGPAPAPVTPAPRPAPAAPPAPLTAHPVAPDRERALGRVRQGDPATRRALNATRRLLSSAARDTELHAETARLIQQPVTTGRQIAVTSIRGGAGKSTVAALLGLTYGHYRSDPVLAVEADAILGTLPHRLGAREVRWSCADLARIVDPSMRITDVTGYLVPFPGGWLLPGSRGAVDGPLDMQSYWTVTTSLRRFFGTTVIDCETLPAEVARLALATAQARVLVAPATVEGVDTTRWVLDWASGLDAGMLAATVVALVHASPDMVLDEGWAVERLEVGGARVVPMPYDRSLAAGGEVRTSLLGQGLRQAAARLAAEAMDRAVRAR